MVIPVTCRACGKKMGIKVPDEMAGKGARFACPACGEKQVYEPPAKPSPPPPDLDERTEVFQQERLGWLVYQGQELPLKLGKNTVGRTASQGGAAIMLATTDKTMSRQHFCIEVLPRRTGTAYLLSDLGSTNGTKLIKNGIDCLIGANEEVYLSNNDTIKVGKELITFVLPDAPARNIPPKQGTILF